MSSLPAASPDQPATPPDLRRFELVEGTSAKFWEISPAEGGFSVRFGRLGTEGQRQLKQVADPAAEIHKLIQEKLKKGYREVTLSAPSPSPNETMETVAPNPLPAQPAAKTTSPKTKAPPRANTRGSAAATTSPESAPEPNLPAAPATQAASKPAPADGASEKRAAPTVALSFSPDGFLSLPSGQSLGIRDGKIVARNKAGKLLASVSKELRSSPEARSLEEALRFFERHELDCKRQVEESLLRSLPLPRSVLEAVWADPAWRTALENLVVFPVISEAQGPDLGQAGLLQSIVAERGLGLITLDGDSRWSRPEAVLIPHPVLIEEPEEWRGLLGELGLRQGVDQLFREVHRKPADLDPSRDSLDSWAEAHFEALLHAQNEARKHNFRVSAGSASTRILEGDLLIEARYELGEGDPMWETTTGELIWVDEQGAALPFSRVGPIAWSEGCRMASLIHARRTPEDQNHD
jgi:predicted DNA-binding WGR domain protein